jgi:hypothetical protein
MMKKTLSLFLAFTLLLSSKGFAEGSVTPAPKYVKKEEKKKDDRWKGITIAAVIVLIGIVTCVVVAHEHNKHHK